MKRARRALVMLSGGLDSAVALYWARRYNWDIQGLSFNYFRRSKREIAAARNLANRAGCQFQIIKLEFLKELEDLKRTAKNKFLTRAPSAYIPARNVIFYGIASSIAEVKGIDFIVAGHNADDARSFSDSTADFFAAFNRATELGLFSHGMTGRVLLPLGDKTKREVILLGDQLGVPFELTWSCYTEAARPCKVCPACKLRASAFKEAGLNDPLMRS